MSYWLIAQQSQDPFPREENGVGSGAWD